MVTVRFWYGVPYQSALASNWYGVTKVEVRTVTSWQGFWNYYDHYGVLEPGAPESVYYVLTPGWNINLVAEYKMGCDANDCRLDCPSDPDGFCCISLDVIENAAKRINAPSPGGVTV